jgi:malonate-semialdehyde dehydrogenase (acetylating)/methylmalonate-semialdehyde dehydrogenase
VVNENGKTLDEARGDVKRGIEAVDFSADIMTHIMGGLEEDVAKGFA